MSLDFFAVNATALRACRTVNYGGHVFAEGGTRGEKRRRPNFSPEMTFARKAMGEESGKRNQDGREWR